MAVEFMALQSLKWLVFRVNHSLSIIYSSGNVSSCNIERV